MSPTARAAAQAPLAGASALGAESPTTTHAADEHQEMGDDVPPETTPTDGQPRGPHAARTLRSQGNELLAMGLGIGTFGVASAVLIGSVCPVCIVATPALLGAGAFRRWQARRRAGR